MKQINFRVSINHLSIIYSEVNFNVSDQQYMNDLWKRQQEIKRILTGKRDIKEDEEYRKLEVEDEDINNVFNAFKNTYEFLNKPDKTDNIEDIFNLIYKYGFSLRPKDPILNGYLESYLQCKRLEEETQEANKKIGELSSEVDELQEKNKNLEERNNNLDKEIGVLQRMLLKTLDFCNRVRNSIWGHLFFRKDIKELPGGDKDLEL